MLSLRTYNKIAVGLAGARYGMHWMTKSDECQTAKEYCKFLLDSKLAENTVSREAIILLEAAFDLWDSNNWRLVPYK